MDYMSLVAVALYTDAHRITGQLFLRERLSDAFNDPLDTHLELNSVRVVKLVDPARQEVEWPSTVIPKAEVLVATLDMDKHESRTTRVDKVTQKAGTRLGCIVGTIEVYGTGHLTFLGSARDVLMHQLPKFFPVTDAMLMVPIAGDSRVSTQLALVNRESAKAFTLL